MANDFNILLSAILDESSAAITDINEQIKRIAAKLSPIILKIEIDDGGSINKLVTQINQIQQASQQVNKSTKQVGQQTKQSMDQTNEAAVAAARSWDKLGTAMKSVAKFTINKDGAESLKSRAKTFDYGVATETIVTNGRGELTGRTVTDNTAAVKKKEELNNQKEYRRNLALHEKDVQRIIGESNRTKQQEYETFVKDYWNTMKKHESDVQKYYEKQQAELSAFNKEYNSTLKAHVKDVTTIEQQQIESEMKMQNDIRLAKEKEAQRVASLGTKKGNSVGFAETDTDFDRIVKAEKALRDLYGSKMELKDFKFDTKKNQFDYTAALKTGKDKFLEYKGAVDVTTDSLYQNGLQAKNTLSRNLGFFDKLKVAISQVPTWMAAMTIFYGSLRSFQQGLKDIADIDAALVNLRKVTNETAETYKTFAIQANAVGIETGKTTSEVIRATAEFARLGYTLEEAKQLSKQALVFSVVGDMDVSAASETLISAIKGFGITVDSEGKNVQKVVDIYNEVGNNFAITSAGISESVKRSASSMHQAGNTLQETVALTTAANGVVQDPEQVGTALKTIAMRLQGVSEEGDKVKDLVPTLQAKFKSIGLTIMDTNGNFKSTFQIMKELSGVWHTLSDIQQADMLEQVAGKRQGNIVAAMLTNWKDAESALQSAMNSTGSAAKEHAAAMDSIEGRMNTFKNTVTGLWQGTLDSSGMKSFIDVGTGLVNILQTITQKMGLVPTVLAVMAAAFVAFNVGPNTGLISGLIRSAYATNSLDNSLGLATGRLIGATAAEQAMGSASVGTALKVGILTRAIGLASFALNAIVGVAIFAAIGAAISWAIGKWQEHNQAIEETKKALEETAKAYSDNRQTIRELITEYEKLSAISKDGALGLKEQERLVEVQDQLGKLLPDIVEKFDAQGHAILKTAAAVQAYADSVGNLVAVQDKETKNNFELSLAEREKKLQDLNDRIALAEEEKNRNNTIVLSASYVPVVSTIEKTSQQKLEDEKNLIALQKQKAELTQNWAKDYNEYVKASLQGANVIGELTKADMDYLKVQSQKEAQQKVDNKTSESHIEIVQRMTKQYESIAEVRKLIKQPLTYAIMGENPDTGLQLIDNATTKINIIRDVLTAAGVDYVTITKIIAEYRAEMDKANVATFDGSAITKKLAKTTQDFISSQKELAQALDDINNGQQLSLDTIMGLVQQYPELLGALDSEHGQLTLNATAVEKLAKLKEETFKNEMKQRVSEMEAEKQRLEAVIQNGLAEIGVIKNVSQVRSGALKDYINAQGAAFFGMEEEARLLMKPMIDNFSNMNAQYDEATQALENMRNATNILTGIDFTAVLGKADDKKPKEDKKPVIPYDLKDYDHKDKYLSNAIEDLTYQLKPFEGKFDKDSLNAVKKLTDSIVDTYKQRLDLSKTELPRLQAEAAEFFKQWQNTTDQELKNEFGRKFDEASSKIDTIKNHQKDWTDEIRKFTTVTDDQKYKVDTFAAAIESLDIKMEESKAAQNAMTKESEASRLETLRQIGIIGLKKTMYADQIADVEKQIAADKAVLASGNLLASQVNALIEKIDQEEQSLRKLQGTYRSLTGDVNDLNKSLEDSKKQLDDKMTGIIDNIISDLKDALKQQQEASTKAIDAIMKEEEKAHKQKMDQYDDELKAFESIVASKLKEIDRESATNDFDKQLGKAQTERADIQKKIDLLSMDNSMEAQAKVAELKKQLSDKDNAIADMKDKRQRDQRKEGLNDELETKRKETEAKKKEEDKQFQDAKDNLEKKKAAIDRYYTELINNEKYWGELRKAMMEGDMKKVQEIMTQLEKDFDGFTKGNFEGLKGQLGTYWTEFERIAKENLETVGISLNDKLSLVEKLKKEIKDLIDLQKEGGVNNPNGGDGSGSGGGTSGGSGGGNTDPKEAAHKQYVQNKVDWWKEYYMTGGQVNTARQLELKQQNTDLRNQYGFDDYNLQQTITFSPELAGFLKDFRAYINNKIEWETASPERRNQLKNANDEYRKKRGFPDWSLDDIKRLGLESLDTGGYTGEWNNTMGKLAVLHQKEIILNEHDTNNLLKVVDILRNRHMVSLPEQPNVGKGQTIIHKIELIIQSLTGDVNGGKTVFSVLVDELKKRGV